MIWRLGKDGQEFVKRIDGNFSNFGIIESLKNPYTGDYGTLSGSMNEPNKFVLLKFTN